MSNPTEPTGPTGSRPTSTPPWTTAGRRRLLIAAAAGVVALLVLVLLVTALRGGSSSGFLDGDQGAAEEAAQEHMTATIDKDFQRQCELETDGHRLRPTVQECVTWLEENSNEANKGPVTLVGAVDLGDGRGYGVAVEYTTPEVVVDEFTTVEGGRRQTAYQVVDDQGAWRIDRSRPFTQNATDYGVAHDLNPIAVALDFLDVKAEE